ncbi:MAG: hypothetical protein ACK5SX_04235, partial [Sandaracinobacter sp.]
MMFGYDFQMPLHSINRALDDGASGQLLSDKPAQTLLASSMIHIMNLKLGHATSILAAIAIAAPGLASSPQTTAAIAEGLSTLQEVPVSRPVPPSGKSDLLIVPIPQSSPSLGTGITLG